MSAGTGRGPRLGVDFGTSTTVAVLGWPDRPARPLLFDGSPLLPSAVCAGRDGDLVVGRDAGHEAQTRPEAYEPNPKRRIDDGAVLLGELEVPVVELVAAVLRRVAEEARRAATAPVSQLTLTYPVAWGMPRREVLVRAAAAAGLPPPGLVPEPIAAARYFVRFFGGALPVGRCLVVYDLGAGTFDAAVVRRTADGFTVLAAAGLPDAGGADVDSAIFAHLGEVYSARDPRVWRRLSQPDDTAARRAHLRLREDIRTGKEMLSRTSTTFVSIPFLDVDAPIVLAELEALAAPIVARTVEVTTTVIRDAGLAPAEVAGVFLVGGASRAPFVSTMLHRALGRAPTALEWPELVVAEGSIDAGSEPAVRRPPPAVAAPDPLPAAAGRVRVDYRGPTALLVGAAAVAAVVPLLASPGGSEVFVAGVRAPLVPTTYPVVLGLAALLGVGRFAGPASRPWLAGPAGRAGLTGRPWRGVMVVLWPALLAATGFLAALTVLAAATRGTDADVLVPRAPPLLLGSIGAGVAVAALGVRLLAGFVPADPLRTDVDGRRPAVPLAIAAAAGILLGIGAHTHRYGFTLDADGIMRERDPAADPVLFLTGVVFGTASPPDALRGLAVYLLGVFAAFTVAILAAVLLREAVRTRPRLRAYLAGTAFGLLAVSGVYLAYHAAAELNYWSGVRPDSAGRWHAPGGGPDPVSRAGAWLWTATWRPVAAAVALAALVSLVRAIRGRRPRSRRRPSR